MWSDPVVEETRKARAEAFAQFENDIHGFFEYLRQRERASGERTVSFENVPVETTAQSNRPR
jgi:hypothetical protein